jgi:glyoxylase-like metal-dependent hydrolase (beta-lactamase superfamily II)
MSETLYFRQLLAGQDFALDDPTAAGMVNFVYLIGDRAKDECVIVDPAWDVEGLAAIAAQDGMKIVGALATHYHPDHVGGSFPGLGVIEGIVALQEKHPMKVHCQKAEAEWIQKATGISKSDLAQHESGDFVTVGATRIQLLHTPGHTPGSQCFLVDNRLVAGDTLFLQGCGRTDLPGGDPEEMYRSLHQRLAKLGDDTVLYPGHLYSEAPSATLGETRRSNYVFQMKSLADWKRLM